MGHCGHCGILYVWHTGEIIIDPSDRQTVQGQPDTSSTVLKILERLQDYLNMRHDSILQLKEQYGKDDTMEAFYRGELNFIQEIQQYLDDMIKVEEVVEESVITYYCHYNRECEQRDGVVCTSKVKCPYKGTKKPKGDKKD